jgi:hypothetical protein
MRERANIGGRFSKHRKAAALPRGSKINMRELIQIDSPSEHACGKPSMERWQVLEPISGRWSWMTVFSCCSQVSLEVISEQDTPKIKRAA